MKERWICLKQDCLLIVDDNFGIRKLLEELFSSEGYTVFTAASGLEAIASAQIKLPDLVLTDIKMPGIDGLELRNKFQALYQNIQIILMSAYSDQIKIIDYGIDYLITKPFDLEQLRMLVANLLNNENMSEQIC